MTEDFQTPSTSIVDFWDVPDAIPEPPDLPPGTLSVLERLGPSPFPKSGFPFLGFLATVYDHIAAHCQPQPSSQAGESTPV